MDLNAIRTIQEEGYSLNIGELRLKDILTDYKIEEREFEYADVKGVAELFGWQIIFFRKQADLSSTIVISFSEIEDDNLISLANSILEHVDIDVRFGDNLSKIKKIYGEANSFDNIFENMTRYNYLIDPGLFIVFGIQEDKMVYLEIITDKVMIDDVFNLRKMLQDM